MAKCYSCAAELANNVRFCSACGAPAGSTDDLPTISLPPTATSPLPPRPSSPSSSRSPSSRPPGSAAYDLSEGRFLPGRLIAGRYRIIALLGKGGMGEVYRADDLTLGQAVALKFLPDEAARDEGLLERFRNEVRMARRVSHPNVCRVYDVGDVDGQTFFTMEYVDGEDLASLLRRIGRLPQDKAVEIARQLCAGLSAAHSKGVLHRDLKPANIMLDGRGQVVITDFGLAGVADNIRGAEIRSGTPAYMAPEQLAGQEVSARSDIYALGLVLYEVFTGKRAFAEKTAAVIGHANSDRTPSRPSSVVKDLDPLIEKVILRCLAVEPSSRPANALAVAAALPGGDPLAAALAAGETPSPQLVAASGETEGLRPRVAVAILAGILLALAWAVYFSVHNSGYDKMGLELTPEVLRQKSREIVTHLGYESRPVDSVSDIDLDGDMENWIEKNDKPHPDWNTVLAGRPTFLHLWYRQSPDTLVASNFLDNLLTPGVVTEQDPPAVLSGMINVQVDMQGRLIYFQAIPKQKLDEVNDASSTVPYDWNILFTAAGLDMSKFQQAKSTWNSLATSDAHMAWSGTWPGTTRALHVEAASFQGKPVFFYLIGDWTKPDRMISTDKKSVGQEAQRIIFILLLVFGLGGATFLARKNYLRGRADREGALRLAVVMFGLELLLFVCRSHFAALGDAIGLTVLAISTALFLSGAMWVLYMAVEPWVRRQWPHAIVSWTRLLSGSLRDPVVGRDILLGVALGVVWILVFAIRSIPLTHLGASPGFGSTDILMGGRQALGRWLRVWPQAIQTTLLFFMLLMGLRFVLRNRWIAAAAFVAIFAVPQGLQSSYKAIEFPAQILVYAIAALIMTRFGLVPLLVAIFTINMTGSLPLSSDLSMWYMPTSIAALVSLLAIAGWGFYHSLGGQPLWKLEME